MNLIKKFIFTKTEGLVLTNKTEINNYLGEKVKHFSEHKNYIDKDELLNLFQEILDMNNHDIATAKFSFSDFENTIGFKLSDEKTKMIYFYNLIAVLGTIYYEVFDKPGNRLRDVEEGSDLPFKTTDMFAAGYNEFLMAKQNSMKNSFGATLIFMTLLERDLKTFIKLVYMDELLRKLETKIAQEKISFNAVDEDLYLYLRHQYKMDIENSSTKIYDSLYASSSLAYNLFESNGIIEDENKEKQFFKGIFGINPLTLNNLIVSPKFKGKVDIRFWNIIDIMFDPNKLNLRNNLTHGNNGYQNYYHINVTSLIYGIYCMISQEMILE
ncbi:DUF4209 domain-containing protein [Sporosarcina sp. BP05]|uniref:DUF4209 domain-containing protein n=1 Tax=Sporosarcina sp. BP05 TaxID=2758726 RepID=UPI001645D03A|nr:DUF4209 domain-containing protein [Sporosarcina sp. BP05]